MSRRSDVDLLQDMAEAARRAADYCEGLDYEGFVCDTKTQDAVVRNIEIIGEAVGNVSEESKRQHPELPWKNMAGMRNRLIHDYFGVNLDVVWDVISNDLPDLMKMLNNMLKERE